MLLPQAKRRTCLLIISFHNLQKLLLKLYLSDNASKYHSCNYTISLCRLCRGSPALALPLNEEVACSFDTELFHGKAALWVTGLANSRPDLFAGQQRKSWLIIQVAYCRNGVQC